MNRVVEVSKKKIQKSLIADSYYVLDRYHIVFYLHDSVYLYASQVGDELNKNIVDTFEAEYPHLTYQSVTTLSMKTITRLRKRIEQLQETI